MNEAQAKAAWFVLHAYERMSLGIVHAAGEAGYVPPATSRLVAGACDRLAELGYLRDDGTRFWLADKARPFLSQLDRLAEAWVKKHGVAA